MALSECIAGRALDATLRPWSPVVRDGDEQPLGRLRACGIGRIVSHDPLNFPFSHGKPVFPARSIVGVNTIDHQLESVHTDATGLPGEGPSVGATEQRGLALTSARKILNSSQHNMGRIGNPSYSTADPLLCRRNISRRALLKIAAAAFPVILPSSVLGLDGGVAPSNRIALGFIGIGAMGQGHLG